MVAVDATLQVLSGAGLEPLRVADDAASSTGRALPVLDAGARAILVDILSRLLATLTVSGSVIVSNPTANPETGLAKDATLTGGTQKTKLVDSAGANAASVSAAGAVKVDGSAVIQPTTATVVEATQPVISVTASASGNNTILTPPAGKKVRLYYFSLSADGANTADVVAFLRFAAAGTGKHKVSLAAKAIFARNIGGGKRYIEGAVNEALIVNLSAAQSVHVSIEYDEI